MLDVFSRRALAAELAMPDAVPAESEQAVKQTRGGPRISPRPPDGVLGDLYTLQAWNAVLLPCYVESMHVNFPHDFMEAVVRTGYIDLCVQVTHIQGTHRKACMFNDHPLFNNRRNCCLTPQPCAYFITALLLTRGGG